MNNNLGVVGLGTMGSQLASNFHIDGFTDYEQFVASLSQPRIILLMVPAGPVVDAVIEELIQFIDKGDVIIDGGNSFYKDSNRRYESLKGRDIHFIGCGISGGSEGARNGCSMMPGGSPLGFKISKEIFSKLSSKDRNGKACMEYIGKEGAGHFVKMVHNGIEYGEMQLIAETFSYLSAFKSRVEIADIFKGWKAAGQSGYLLDITIEIIGKKEGEVYVLDRISDRASGKGTGRWSVNAGLEIGSVVSVMAAALNARLLSSDSELRKNALKIQSDNENVKFQEKELLEAYSFARLINHLQGFHLIRQASIDYNWDLNLKEIARIWTNGCIIRSQLMEDLAFSYTAWDQLLDLTWYKERLENSLISMQAIIIKSAGMFLPMDAFSSAFNYWLGINKDQLPTNLIQAQRDYFGNHGFKLADASDELLHHFKWK